MTINRRAELLAVVVIGVAPLLPDATMRLQEQPTIHITNLVVPRPTHTPSGVGRKVLLRTLVPLLETLGANTRNPSSQTHRSPPIP